MISYKATQTREYRKLKRILDGAEEWRKRHGSQFERSKYILVHYTRNIYKETKAPVTINGTLIEQSNEAKYLGIIFDQELRVKSHLQHAAKKGTNTAMTVQHRQKHLGDPI